MEEYKCSSCDSKENTALRDLGYEEYIPLCQDCYVEWCNIQISLNEENE